jgi:hypothetical protein
MQQQIISNIKHAWFTSIFVFIFINITSIHGYEVITQAEIKTFTYKTLS